MLSENLKGIDNFGDLGIEGPVKVKLSLCLISLGTIPEDICGEWKYRSNFLDLSNSRRVGESALGSNDSGQGPDGLFYKPVM